MRPKCFRCQPLSSGLQYSAIVPRLFQAVINHGSRMVRRGLIFKPIESNIDFRAKHVSRRDLPRNVLRRFCTNRASFEAARKASMDSSDGILATARPRIDACGIILDVSFLSYHPARIVPFSRPRFERDEPWLAKSVSPSERNCLLQRKILR